MKKIVASLLVLMLAGATSAQATDWSGFYAGLQVGGSAVSGTTKIGGDQIASPSANQITLGGFLGYNWTPSEMLLIGIEGDLNAKFGHGDNVVAGPAIETGWQTTSPWESSIRARVGITPAEGFLLYGTAGIGMSSFKFDNPSCSGCAIWGDDNILTGTRLGGVIGLGGEMALTDQVHLKLEYLHGYYGVAKDGPISTPLSTDAVRLGVSYKF